jgi:hypothetical protein
MSGMLDPGLVELAKALARMNAARDLTDKTHRKHHAHGNLRPLQQSAAK